jgi:hypothetical protein
MSHREGTHQGYRHAVRGPYARISSQSRAARQGKWEQREIIADYVRARETAPSSHNRELAVDFSRGECLT